MCDETKDFVEECPSKPFGDDPYTLPSRSRQGLADSFFECGGNWGASETFTLTPGPRKAGADSFRNHRTLELGKYALRGEFRLIELPGSGKRKGGGCAGVMPRTEVAPALRGSII